MHPVWFSSSPVLAGESGMDGVIVSRIQSRSISDIIWIHLLVDTTDGFDYVTSSSLFIAAFD